MAVFLCPPPIVENSPPTVFRPPPPTVPQLAVTVLVTNPYCEGWLPPPPAMVAPRTPLATLFPGALLLPPNPPITLAPTSPPEPFRLPCKVSVSLTEPVRFRLPSMVWLAVKVLLAPTSANALEPYPPSVAAFTLLRPEPLPVKLPALTAPIADTPPATLTKPLDCDIIELPSVELLIQIGIVPAVPAPWTDWAWAPAAPQLRVTAIRARTSVQEFIFLCFWFSALCSIIRGIVVFIALPHSFVLRIRLRLLKKRKTVADLGRVEQFFCCPCTRRCHFCP